MICSANDLLFAALLFVFTAVAVFSEWQMNSLMKILELRHSAAYKMLGRPHPFRTGESDRHSFALLKFVISDAHALLNDTELTRNIRVLRFFFAANLITVFIMLVSLLGSQDAAGLVTFACWFN